MFKHIRFIRASVLAFGLTLLIYNGYSQGGFDNSTREDTLANQEMKIATQINRLDEQLKKIGDLLISLGVPKRRNSCQCN